MNTYAKTRTTPYSVSFDTICKEVIGKTQMEHLRKLLDFKFKRYSTINLLEERLQAIEKHIQIRVRELMRLPRGKSEKQKPFDCR